MIHLIWGNSETACQLIGINNSTLKKLREHGYLKQGTHWRQILENSSNHFDASKQFEDKIVYHIPWCIEEISIWKARDARIPFQAA